MHEMRVRHRPVDVFHTQTVLSVDDVAMKSDFFDQEMLQMVDQSAEMILAMPRVRKSQTTRRPSEQPTASIEPAAGREARCTFIERRRALTHFVEGTADGDRGTIQDAIELLGIVLLKRGQQLDIHDII